MGSHNSSDILNFLVGQEDYCMAVSPPAFTGEEGGGVRHTGLKTRLLNLKHSLGKFSHELVYSKCFCWVILPLILVTHYQLTHDKVIRS